MLINGGVEFALVWLAHFPGVTLGNVDALKCWKCTDLNLSLCKGERRSGQGVVECLMEKITEVPEDETGLLYTEPRAV